LTFLLWHIIAHESQLNGTISHRLRTYYPHNIATKQQMFAYAVMLGIY